jgi:hypothetical protein
VDIKTKQKEKRQTGERQIQERKREIVTRERQIQERKRLKYIKRGGYKEIF